MLDLRKPLGKKNSQLRKQKELTKEKLPEILDIARNSLSNVESGRSFMSFKNIQRLIEIFEIEPYKLFIFDKTEPSKIIHKEVKKETNSIKNDKDKLMLVYEYINKLN